MLRTCSSVCFRLIWGGESCFKDPRKPYVMTKITSYSFIIVIYIFAVSKEYANPAFPKEMETSNNNGIYRTHVLKQGLLTRHN